MHKQLIRRYVYKMKSFYQFQSSLRDRMQLFLMFCKFEFLAFHFTSLCFCRGVQLYFPDSIWNHFFLLHLFLLFVTIFVIANVWGYGNSKATRYDLRLWWKLGQPPFFHVLIILWWVTITSVVHNGVYPDNGCTAAHQHGVHAWISAWWVSFHSSEFCCYTSPFRCSDGRPTLTGATGRKHGQWTHPKFNDLPQYKST